MSQDKLKQFNRAVYLLLMAEHMNIPIHMEGGIALEDERLQYLSENGFVEIYRGSRGKHIRKTKRFDKTLPVNTMISTDWINRTRAELTEKGKIALVLWKRENPEKHFKYEEDHRLTHYDLFYKG